MEKTFSNETFSGRANNGAQSAAHAEVFKNPDEYLAVLRSNFSKLAHGDDILSLHDLQLASANENLDPKLREAAALSATHFNDLLNIRNQSAWGDPASHVIHGDDIDFARDMIDGTNLTSRTVNQIGGDVFGVGVAVLASATAEGIGAAFVGAGGAAAVTAGIGFVGLGIAALGVAGYSVYEGTQEHKRIESLSQMDHVRVSAWFK